MLTKDAIEAQLKRLGVNVKGWGATEIQELKNIIMAHEEITGYSHGWYENGFATLVSTTERLLLVDKKLFHLTIEDVRYDMIAEVNYNARLIDATVRVMTLNKTLRFTSFNQKQLRQLTTYVQRRVLEMRQQMFSWQQFEQTPVRNFAPAAQPALAVDGPGAAPIKVMSGHPYTKTALTTNHHRFLPKVPRRFRPVST